MAKKISDLPETTNIELDDIVWVDKYENGELKSKRFKLLSIFSKLKSVFGVSLFGTGDIDSPKDGKTYGRKDGVWKEVEVEEGISVLAAIIESIARQPELREYLELVYDARIDDVKTNQGSIALAALIESIARHPELRGRLELVYDERV